MSTTRRLEVIDEVVGNERGGSGGMELVEKYKVEGGI